jgi:hypothetical protein
MQVSLLKVEKGVIRRKITVVRNLLSDICYLPLTPTHVLKEAIGNSFEKGRRHKGTEEAKGKRR